MSGNCEKCGWHVTECMCDQVKLGRESLERLNDYWQRATSACPPDEYDFRNRELLLAIAAHLLQPLWNEGEK